MDKSKEIYDLLKQGKDLTYIAEKVGSEISRYSIINTILTSIIPNCWVFQSVYTFLDFVNMLDATMLGGGIIEKYMSNAPTIEYKEEYITMTRNIINNYWFYFYESLTYDFIRVFKNYINKQDLLNMHANNQLTDGELFDVLKDLDKVELFDNIVFTSKMINNNEEFY